MRKSNFGLLLVASTAIGLTGVEVDQIDLDRFAECPGCAVEVVADLRLGAGEPVITSDVSWGAYNPATSEYTVVASPSRLEVFDSRGKYRRGYGKKGVAPGEFDVIRDVQFQGGKTIVMDVGQSRITIVRGAGTPTYNDVPVAEVGRFVMVAPDTAVVAAMGESPEDVGLPLHLIGLTSRTPSIHFGSELGDFNQSAPWSGQVFISKGQNRSVWVGRPARLHFEEWSVKGDLLRVIDGSPKWFPPVITISPFGKQPPQTRMRQFVVDARGLLWVMSWVAAPDWKKAVTSAVYYTDEVVIDPKAYFASRVDVFDLKARVHVASKQFNHAYVQFLERGDEMLVQWVEDTKDGGHNLVLNKLVIHSSRR